MMDDKRNLLHSLTIDRTAMNELPEPRPAWQRIVGILALIGVGVAGGVAVTQFWGTSGTQSPAVATTAGGTAATPGTGTTVAPAPRPMGGLVASGYVVARRTATVSAELTGRVQDVLVEEGMVVTKGQVLARLDSTLAGIDLDLAKARIASAQAHVTGLSADLRDAEQALRRTSSLSKAANASEADLTRAQARADSLRAQIQGAKADLEVARISVDRQTETVDRHIIRAPFDGVVIDKNAQPGEIISPMSSGGFTRTGVCTLVDMASLEIEVDVNEANIGRVRAGQKVEAILDAYPEWKIPASVIAVVPRANRDKATIKVRIALAERDGRVLPDMGAKVTFLDAKPAG